MHTSKFLTLTVSLVVLSISQAHARGPFNPDIVSAANQVYVGAGVLHQNYKEFNDGLVPSLPSVLDSEDGNIITAQVGYSALTSYLYGQVQLSVSVGETNYTGYLVSPGPVYTPYLGTTDNNIVNLIGRAGYPFRAGSRAVVVPYLEVGHFFWRRDIGYVEDYSHFLLGLGAKLLWSPTSKLVVETGLGIGTTVAANMNVDGYNYDLGSEPYRNGYLAVDYRLHGRWHLRLSAEYRAWEYAQSPVVAGFLEPRSETLHATYMLSAGYSFAK